jgi:Putative endonuclease segE, GIY-YIG domain
MTWIYQNQTVEELPEECVGFVYVIVNNISGRKYIGKKLAKFAKTTYKVVKLKNGTKKKKKIRGKIESDWRDYYGSNIELNKDVEQLGKENFTREIIYYCNSKAECSYIEAREQFNRKVLESNDWYNGHIQVRVHGSHIIKSQLLIESQTAQSTTQAQEKKAK